MGDAGFFKGTSATQDSRFSDKELKLRKILKFPSEFDQKVDMKKVNLAVMRPWIARRVGELVGFEDEVVVEYAMGLLEDTSKPPDPKAMQINLTGFLEGKTPEFMLSLWKLLLSAQSSIGGVPKEFIEEKKEELRQKQLADEKVMGEVMRRKEVETASTLRLDEIRERERRERREGGGGRGRGRGSMRGRDGGWGARGGRGGNPGRGGYDHPRDTSRSRSPPRRRYSPPPARFRSRSPRRQRSPSRSRSPPPRRRVSPSPSPTRSPYRRTGRYPSRSRSPLPKQGKKRRSVSRSPSVERDRRRQRRSPSRTPPFRGKGKERSPPPKKDSPRRKLEDRIEPSSKGGGNSLTIKGAASRAQKDTRAPGSPRRTRSRSISRSTNDSLQSPERTRSRSRGRITSRSRTRSNSPDRRPRSRSGSTPRNVKGGRRYKSRTISDSRSRSRSRSASPTRSPRRHRMDVDSPKRSRTPEYRHSKGKEKEGTTKPLAERLASSRWAKDSAKAEEEAGNSRGDLDKKESELKEKALRQKVIKSRKGTGA